MLNVAAVRKAANSFDGDIKVAIPSFAVKFPQMPLSNVASQFVCVRVLVRASTVSAFV